VNGETIRLWKEASMAYFKILSQHVPGRTEEYHKNLSEQLASEPRSKPGTS
jgi:hypothetical protein